MIKNFINFGQIRLRLADSKAVAAVHLGFSVVAVGLIAFLVFYFWYPYPYRAISNSTTLFLLVVAVDVVCGPLLTLILFDRTKSRMALAIDLCLIAFIQLSALSYGIYSLAQAKPIAIVFEVDRFRIISTADIVVGPYQSLPGWVNPWGLDAPRLLGIRRATTLDEKVDSVTTSLQGIEPSQRPEWWQPYNLSVQQVLAAAHPLSELQKLNPSKIVLLDRTILQLLEPRERHGKIDPIVWLPLVSRGMQDWVILLNGRTGEVEGQMNLNGFGS